MSLVREDLIPARGPTTVFNLIRSLSFVRSDSFVHSLFSHGRIRLNGSILSGDANVDVGDELFLLTPQSLEPTVAKDYDIVYEDDYILVVNKPAPLPVHPAGRYYFNSLTSLLNQDRPDIDLFTVHRLDRETSGLIVFAKSRSVAQSLFKQFKSQSVKKSYLAVVHGVPAESGSFSSTLVESSFGDIRDAVLPVSVGKLSKTDYSLVSSSDDRLFSLLRLVPFSGKKHQIRVHLATAGFPIVGDKQYGFYPEKLTDYFLGNLSDSDILSFWLSSRHLLHCDTLSFLHPKSLRYVSFKAKIKQDMLNFLKEAHFNLIDIV